MTQMKKILSAAVALIVCLSCQAQEVINLPKPDKAKATMSVMDALAQRRSVRSFSTVGR